MALEAQLCPQCGATVSFGEHQTEAVCAYCGATVAKPAAPVAAVTAGAAGRLAGRPRQLSTADWDKAQQLAVDGRRPEAVELVQRATGLNAKMAGDDVDNLVAGWARQHRRPEVASNQQVLRALAAGLAVLALAGWLSLNAVLLTLDPLRPVPLPQTDRGGFMFCTISVDIVGLVVLLSVLGSNRGPVQRRWWLITSQPTAATVTQVVRLGPAAAQPGAPVLVRLGLKLGASQPPRTLELALDLPEATANRLAAGTRIAVITHGAEFTYVPLPITIMA